MHSKSTMEILMVKCSIEFTNLQHKSLTQNYTKSEKTLSKPYIFSEYNYTHIKTRLYNIQRVTLHRQNTCRYKDQGPVSQLHDTSPLLHWV